MEIVGLIFNAENVRMLVLIAFGFCGYILIKTQMKDLENSLGKRIDGVDHKIDNVEASLNKKIDNVEASLNKKIDNVEASLNKKIDDVEASLNKKIDDVEASLNKKIDNVETSLLKAMDDKIAIANNNLYTQLKTNDFKHLNDTIEALTFMLEKNKFLTREDKEYIDGRLDK